MFKVIDRYEMDKKLKHIDKTVQYLLFPSRDMLCVTNS